MLINKSFYIDSCDDVELGIKRSSKLEYRISYDDEKQVKAIVFIIGAYGANANISFLDFDRAYIAKKFDVVAIHVFYHCFCNRISTTQEYSAFTRFTKEDLPRLAKVLQDFNIDTKHLNEDNAYEYYDLLNHLITKLKAQAKLVQNYQVELSASFIPRDGTYQNYGIMAAIDHINVLKDLLRRFKAFKKLPKIMGGGSYGGYLALLIAKIAPWYVDGVIDNSATVLPLLESIIGRELNKAEFIFHEPNALIKMFNKSYWTRKDEHSPYFFENENYMIRALLNSNHLKIQAKINKNTIFTSYHSLKDEFDTAKNKQVLFLAYKDLGFDASLHLIKDDKDVDGKFIKNLKHGMRISDRALFTKELPLILEKLKAKQFFTKENRVSYPCKDKTFTFKDVGDKFELFIS